MTKDYQRQKVYDWEKSIAKHFGEDMWGAEITPKECEQLATKIWNRYKNKTTYHFNERYDYCSKVKVKLVGGNKCTMRGGYFHSKRRTTKDGRGSYYKKMHLNHRGCNKKIVIHEIAHALSPRNSKHDEYFVGIYMYLMAKYLGYDLKFMINSANENKINFTWKQKGQFTGYVSPLSKLIRPYLKDKPQTKSLALPTTGRYLVLPSALKA